MYGLPWSTLHDRVSGIVTMDCSPGKRPYLTMLVSFLLNCAKISSAHTHIEFFTLVCRIVESKVVHHVITDNLWRRFIQRHPHLKLRTAMPLHRQELRQVMSK